MKKDTTTILGFIFVIGAIIVTLGDQWLSMNPEYTFELVGWQVLSVLGAGMCLIVVPQNKMVNMLVRLWDAIVKRISK